MDTTQNQKNKLKSKIDLHCYTVQWSVTMKMYAARVLGFPWFCAFGDTPETALMEIRRKVAEVEEMLEEGKDADTRTEEGSEEEKE